MTKHYQKITFSEAVKDKQSAMGSRSAYRHDIQETDQADLFGSDETAFISQRDSFYMATVNEDGWPYVQHRGGPVGFVKILDETRFAIADYRGNRQYISVGNVAKDNRTSLFFMDYLNRRRLKVLARVHSIDMEDDPDTMSRLTDDGYSAKVERGLVFELEAFDWNCPQHITERYALDDVKEVTERFQNRIAELEAEVARLKEGG